MQKLMYFPPKSLQELAYSSAKQRKGLHFSTPLQVYFLALKKVRAFTNPNHYKILRVFHSNHWKSLRILMTLEKFKCFSKSGNFYVIIFLNIT